MEEAALAALDRERVAREAALEEDAAAVEGDVEFGELGRFRDFVWEEGRAGPEDMEEVGRSRCLGAAACGAAHGGSREVFGWSSRCDGYAGSGLSEEEVGSVEWLSETGGRGIRAQRACLHDLGQDVRRSLPEVPASFPCVVEHFDELGLRPLRRDFAVRLQNECSKIISK